MWNQWFNKKYNKISFEDLQFAINNHQNYIIINTLPLNEQTCLIKNTISCQTEEKIVNDFIQKYEYRKPKFIVYGKNSSDITAETKCKQLLDLGFTNVYIYTGGMFEWLLLQDIYGKNEFPTTSKMLDILKYKPNRQFGGYFIDM